MTDRPIKVIKKPVEQPDMDADLRRLLLGLTTLLRRRYPNDWRQIIAKANIGENNEKVLA